MGGEGVECRGRPSDTRPGIRWDVAQMAFVDDAEANWQASGLDRRTYDGLGSVVYSPHVYGWLVLDGRRLFPMRQCGRLRWMEH